MLALAQTAEGLVIEERDQDRIEGDLLGVDGQGSLEVLDGRGRLVHPGGDARQAGLGGGHCGTCARSCRP